ncbi:uncharacterized protein GGS22DRAFT_40826 [Annulohypoxylon maeteangense]|uniref:uncharacterized protein n=1 Tax=Annulohypoxylon maeteangense TaxID=1927788 RepID=UPI002008D6FB|nr:uncharacterized protein GGS22DRAFT_40826 [Annulohypoxylon maeteangense]KAI0882785.1 hypothetical protein GGS22DRAFT_40826 [Annulohypoxylon maeteangense]
MAESAITTPTSPALEALQNRSRDIRRARPPDITVIRNEARVPLRPPKRESRIGLRNIFSKSKTVKDEKIVEEAPSPQESSRYGSKRSSLVDIGNWPQRLHPTRSDLSLLSSPPSSIKSPASVTSTASSRLRQNSITANQGKLRQQGSPKVRDSVTGFIPPPLFQMYPQAIKYATLPTCVTPIEALSRINELKDNSQQHDFSLNQGEAEKRKKSKNAPEWTSKVYALVTSGYLLQYAGEGRFDRLPERILHLTRDSAAYASDLIPGKHWVVQVASSMDADGNPAMDAKSLRSKLALRGVEKRQVTNMLLVFESPEGMDLWLAILRREIESLGGKKKLSETGKPEMENGTMLRNQGSQRTLVVRDPARFSRIISQDFSWKQENALADPIEQTETAEPRLERRSESTVDDGSSMVSSDGQRLDSLRDSGSGSGSSGSSGNRLSFISSGQRTLVSSAESSPANSPIRASFSSNGEDQLFQLSQKPLPPTPEVRPRPNAAAIANRRQSMQTMIPSFDPRLDVRGRSIPTLPSSLTSVRENKHQFVPNFSVPHTVGRRYSAMNLSAAASRENQPQTSDREGPIRPVRRSPPTKLAISRPLSIVMDQPSPRSPYSPTAPPNQARSSVQTPDTASIFTPRANLTPKQSPHERSETPESQILKQMTEEANLTSTSVIAPFHEKRAMRASQQYQQPRLPYFDMDKSFIARPARAQTLNTLAPPDEIRRASSSLEMRRSSMNSNFGHQSYKHALLLTESPPQQGSHQNRHSFIHPNQSHLPSIEEPAYALAPPLICTPKRSAPSLKALQQESLSNDYLGIDSGERALLTRRSLPHLADGPPPAPPPTCALPPLPAKRSSNLSRAIKA